MDGMNHSNHEDRFNLRRFIEAQATVYPVVVEELQRGRKSSHWMWFIFPQISGLGRSATAKNFAIRSGDEARAYLDHPLLGERLIKCTRLVNNVSERTAAQIFGYPDELKFRSSMTLFNAVNNHIPVFAQALEQYFEGEPDQLTLDILGQQNSAYGET